MNPLARTAALLALATPLAAQQSPNPLQIEQVAPHQFALTWFGDMLRPYQIEGSADLSTWADIGDPQVGENDDLGDVETNSAPTFFYRLREGAMRPGFDDLILNRNDDETYPFPATAAPVDIGFPVLFYGTTYTQCYVNNNGNITFGQKLEKFTPDPLNTLSGTKIIAPFWADVDTRNVESNVVRFTGAVGEVAGHLAFGVTSRNVGYFERWADKLNSFQMILIDRSDVAAGDFDVEFNYNSILWETGDASAGVFGYGGSPARVGVSSGSGHCVEYQGSGQTLAFLDADPATGTPNYQSGLIYQTYNSEIPGRILIPFRGGVPPVSFTVDAGPDQQLDAASGGAFDLYGSTLPAPLVGATFEWKQVEGYPEATFSSKTVLNPTVTITEPGTFKFRLSATKPGIFTEMLADEVMVTHPAEFQVAGGYYPLESPALFAVQLDQAAASFTGNPPLSVKWSHFFGPEAGIDDDTLLQPTVTISGPGYYIFKMVVTTLHSQPFTKTAYAIIEYGE